ncbi:MAG: hypothetical protein Q8R42_02170, partial [Desulfocapsaceae bacterium]|nr:hypothetical protein [Desulfocapsaceae bacterium]
MLKTKIITYSFCAISMVAAPLTVAVTNAHAWDVMRIDYETHNGNTNPVKGIYLDKGEWKSWNYAAINNWYRYLSYEVGPTRHGIAFWLVKIPKTGFYQLKTAFQSTKHRTYDANYAVYVNATMTEAENKTAKPVYETIVDQRSPNPTVSETKWAEMGTYCLQKNDISMLVLDGRDDTESDSADATDWTFVGEEYNSQRCTSGANMVPINHLLLRPKI